MKFHLLSRYGHMFSIAMQDALQSRSTALIWFLYALLNTMAALLLWVAGFANNSIAGEISLSYIQLYYVLMLVANSSLLSHIEEDVAAQDIKEGGLVKYLLKPVSYFWYKFVIELPWRVMGAIFSISALVVLSFFLPLRLPIPSPLTLVLIVVTMGLTVLLSFVYKMVISMSAFWFTEGWAFFEVMEAVVLFIAGYVMPLALLPSWLQGIAFALPFAYMIYLPVQALTGQLSDLQILQGMAMQILWILILGAIYRMAWKRGLSRFTGVGQ